MKYHYFYQSRDNKSLDDWIEAKDRNEAYFLLRKRGIKPYKLLGRNPHPWKRWAAIVVLGVIVAILSSVVLQELAADRREAFAWEERSQVYGDPERLHELSADGWLKAMGSEGDAWLARHGRPGIICDCNTKSPSTVELSTEPLRIESTDVPEVAKMKRIVNGMKRELAAYLAADGRQGDYKLLCDERLRTEQGIIENLAHDFKILESRLSKDNYEATSATWAKKSALLRSMGLPTVPMPDPAY